MDTTTAPPAGIHDQIAFIRGQQHLLTHEQQQWVVCKLSNALDACVSQNRTLIATLAAYAGATKLQPLQRLCDLHREQTDAIEEFAESVIESIEQTNLSELIRAYKSVCSKIPGARPGMLNIRTPTRVAVTTVIKLMGKAILHVMERQMERSRAKQKKVFYSVNSVLESVALLGKVTLRVYRYMDVQPHQLTKVYRLMKTSENAIRTF